MSLYEKIKPYLKDGNQETRTDCISSYFICDAVGRARNAKHITADEAVWLLETISARLQPNCTVRLWMDDNIKDPVFNHMSDTARILQVQAYKHRWLKHLCEEYENNKGTK